MSNSALSARRLALLTLEKIAEGDELETAWNRQAAAPHLEERDRTFARQLILTVLRRYGELATIVAQRVKQAPPLRTRLILYLGAAQLLWLNTPDHAAVDSSVNLAKKTGAMRQAGLVNAVLKRIARERPALLEASDPRHNLPDWLRHELEQDYDHETIAAIARAQLIQPPLDITLAAGEQPEDWTGFLDAAILPTGTLRRERSGMVAQLPGYGKGTWWVQDAASALPARLFSPLQGKRALDLCAAPGGKCLQMAAAGAEVTAVDRSAHRLRRLQENLARTGLLATIIESDARQFAPPHPMDAILLDAPCTATGTLRRHPDVALHRTPEDVAELTALQAALLDHAAQILPIGGELVYCVCSLLKREGEQQISALLARHPQLSLVPVDAGRLGIPPAWVAAEGWLRILPSDWPELGGIDGFFAALLRK